MKNYGRDIEEVRGVIFSSMGDGVEKYNNSLKVNPSFYNSRYKFDNDRFVCEVDAPGRDRGDFVISFDISTNFLRIEEKERDEDEEYGYKWFHKNLCTGDVENGENVERCLIDVVFELKNIDPFSLTAKMKNGILFVEALLKEEVETETIYYNVE